MMITRSAHIGTFRFLLLPLLLGLGFLKLELVPPSYSDLLLQIQIRTQFVRIGGLLRGLLPGYGMQWNCNAKSGTNAADIRPLGTDTQVGNHCC